MSAPGLRFAMVTTFYPPYHFGGEAMYVRHLSHTLARHGHTVDVIHDVDAFRLLRPGVELEPLQEPERVHIHRLRHPLGALSCLLTQQIGRPILNGRRLRHILDGGGYDVIHYHSVSLVGGLGALAFGNAIKLYTAHEHWLVCPTHALWRHKRELCTGRQCFRCLLHYRRPPQVWRWTGFLTKSIRHVDAFLAPSAFTAEKHTEFEFPRTMEVMPYFLPESDGEDGTDASLQGEKKPLRPYFLFAGRLEREKGVQDVIPLFDESSRAEFWIAGRGTFEPELRRLAAGNPRVRFLGQRTPSELRKLYAAATALVVPSIFYETFGYVVLEAFVRALRLLHGAADRLSTMSKEVVGDCCSTPRTSCEKRSRAWLMSLSSGRGWVKRRTLRFAGFGARPRYCRATMSSSSAWQKKRD